MPFINSFVCPKCSQPFPLFMKSSIRINRGLLLADLKCLNCGQVSRQKIDALSAAWAWPLTIGVFTAVIYQIRRSFLYRESPLLYFLIVFMMLAFFFIGLRRGLKLVPAEKNKISQSIFRKWVIPSIVITLYSLAFGYYTHDWLNVVMGISIGLIVWISFYYLAIRSVDNGNNFH